MVQFAVLFSAPISINNLYAHHIVKEIAVPNRPMKLNIDNDGLLYMANLGKPTVTVVNTATDDIKGEITLNPAVEYSRLRLHPQKYIGSIWGPVK